MTLSRTVIPTLVLVLAANTACTKDPTQGKEQAQVKAAVEAAPAVANATSIKITPQNSSIEFTGAKVSATHEGSFKEFSGEILLADGGAEASSVSITIPVRSLSIEPAKLAGHLLTPDFFDPEKFPNATFQSTKIEKDSSGGGTHKVTGNLDLHGQKKSISFPAKIEIQDKHVKVDAEFGINRKDFGIVYPGAPDDLIKDDVLIELKLHAAP